MVFTHTSEFNCHLVNTIDPTFTFLIFLPCFIQLSHSGLSLYCNWAKLWPVIGRQDQANGGWVKPSKISCMDLYQNRIQIKQSPDTGWSHKHSYTGTENLKTWHVATIKNCDQITNTTKGSLSKNNRRQEHRHF